MFLPWFLCGVLFIICLMLLLKIYFLKKGVQQISERLSECLSDETNMLLSTSSCDPHIINLADQLNQELRMLRKQQQQYLNGGWKLKDAITNISHDLRTPLTAIRGYLDLLDSMDKNEQVSQYLLIIKERCDTLVQLSEELFTYSLIASQKDEIATEIMAINPILEECLIGFYALFQKQKIIPSIQITNVNVIRRINKEALSRVFSNIISNAIKYSDGDLHITLNVAGEICFSNTASSLNKIQVGKLFERYYTLESAQKSTGLGLAISRTLIEQMNGHISAEYNNNQLCIRIVLDIEK